MFVPSSGARAADVVDRPDAIGQAIVVGQDDAALSSVEVFACLEAEGSQVAERADFAASPLGGVGLGRIFDEGETTAARDLRNVVHVGRASGDVDGDVGARVRRDGAFDP